MENYNGTESRQGKVGDWLKESGFRGEYLLVSTRPDSIYSKKLAALKPNQKLIVDLYTPIFLEKELTLSKWKPQDWITRIRNKEMVKKFLKRGNHFLVANRRQREYWLKTAQSLGVALRVNDISVLPTGSSLTINHQPLSMHDRQVVLWFGGIYPWMDPEPLVEAFSRICRKYPKWKLRFLGGWQPGTGYKERYEKLINKAKASIPDFQLQVVGWQKNKDLGKFLKDVSFAVHLVKPTLEDYYAHRVRLLTLLNSGIPVVTSGKDVISDLMVKAGAGERVGDSSEEIQTSISKRLTTKAFIHGDGEKSRKIESLYIKQEADTADLEKFL